MYEKEGHGRARARELLSKSGYASGGHFKADDRKAKTAGKIGTEIVKAVHEHESALHKGKPKTPIKLKSGGMADGGTSPKRLDRGSRKKPTTEINIMVAPKDNAGPPPIPPALAAAAMAKKPQMPMGAQPNPAAPPMPMAKKGGRQCRAMGGRAGAKMTAGAASGEGRLEKEAIQKKARK